MLGEDRTGQGRKTGTFCFGHVECEMRWPIQGQMASGQVASCPGQELRREV